MDPLLLILVVSIITIACFAIGGFLLGRSSGSNDPAEPETQDIAETAAEAPAAEENADLEQEISTLCDRLEREEELRRDAEDRFERALDVVDALKRLTASTGTEEEKEEMSRELAGQIETLEQRLERETRLLLEAQQAKKQAEERAGAFMEKLELLKRKMLLRDEELSKRREQAADLQAEIARLAAQVPSSPENEEERARLKKELDTAFSNLNELKSNLEQEKQKRAELENQLAGSAGDSERVQKLRDELEQVHVSLKEKETRISEMKDGSGLNQSEDGAASTMSGHKQILDLSEVGSLSELLSTLVQHSEISAAVIADDHGLLIEGAADGKNNEAMAAITTLLSELPALLTEGVRMNPEPREVSVMDADGLMLVARFFDVAGARCTLAMTSGRLDEASAIAEQAVGAIQSIL